MKSTRAEEAEMKLAAAEKRLAGMEEALRQMVSLGQKWGDNFMGVAALQRKRWEKLVKLAEAALTPDSTNFHKGENSHDDSR